MSQNILIVGYAGDNLVDKLSLDLAMKRYDVDSIIPTSAQAILERKNYRLMVIVERENNGFDGLELLNFNAGKLPIALISDRVYENEDLMKNFLAHSGKNVNLYSREKLPYKGLLENILSH